MQNVIKIVLYINLETSQKNCFKFVKSLSVVIKNVDHYLSFGGRGVLGCFWPFFSEREGSSSLDLTLDVTQLSSWCLQENCKVQFFGLSIGLYRWFFMKVFTHVYSLFILLFTSDPTWRKVKQECKYSWTYIKRHRIKRSPFTKRLVVKVLNHCNFHLS